VLATYTGERVWLCGVHGGFRVGGRHWGVGSSAALGPLGGSALVSIPATNTPTELLEAGHCRELQSPLQLPAVTSLQEFRSG
jgi:hypothetical protein